MDLLAQYYDISDGENEAEMQAQQLAAHAAQRMALDPQLGEGVHQVADQEVPPDAENAAVEESADDSSSEDDSDSEEEEKAPAVPLSAAPIDDLLYVAMVAGVLEPEPSAAAEADPNEIGIDSVEDGANEQPVAASTSRDAADAAAGEAASDTTSDTSSDTSDAEPDAEPLDEPADDAAAWFTEEELQSGVAPDEVPRTKNEIEPELSPVEVQIGPEEQIFLAGHVMYRIDHENTAVVQAEKTQTPLGDGSILCFDDRSILGQVYETFGPVTQPFYVTRWHPSQPPTKEFAAGTPVFSPRTQAVLVKPTELISKGCDASNMYDEELPPHEQDFSDDEQEAAVKAQKKKQTKLKVKTARPARPSDLSQAAAAAAASGSQQPPASAPFSYASQPYPPPPQPQQQYCYPQQPVYQAPAPPPQQQQYYPASYASPAATQPMTTFTPAPPTSAPPPRAPAPAPTYQFTPSPVHLTSQAQYQQPAFQQYTAHIAQPFYPSAQPQPQQHQHAMQYYPPPQHQQQQPQQPYAPYPPYPPYPPR